MSLKQQKNEPSTKNTIYIKFPNLHELSHKIPNIFNKDTIDVKLAFYNVFLI